MLQTQTALVEPASVTISAKDYYDSVTTLANKIKSDTNFAQVDWGEIMLRSRQERCK